jgi:cytochrome b6-f complex iron-sulfur subunit
MDRRNFLKSTGIACGLAMLAPTVLLESCQKSSLVPEGPTVNFTLNLNQGAIAALKVSGGSVATNGVVVVNSNGSYTAVAQSCTHQGCSVAYNKSGNDFVCPCHGGTYDINGNVVSGPPPAPLKQYTVTQNGEILTVVG